MMITMQYAIYIQIYKDFTFYENYTLHYYQFCKYIYKYF